MISANPDLSKLVLGFDSDLLAKFVHALRANNYPAIQYLPTRSSLFAIARDPSNLVNLVSRRSHRAFMTSAFPRLYQKGLALTNPRLGVGVRACFFSEKVRRTALETLFDRKLIERGIGNGILRSEGDLIQFTVSFVPFRDDILVRDPFYVYPPAKEKLEGYVWMGADSIMLASFLTVFLHARRFDAALEIGSGSGIQSLVASRFSRSCLAIDYNERAIAFTGINARLNGASNLQAKYSDLYKNVQGKFDLIVANPWFCDLVTGGLEEVPGIMEGLDTYLREDGMCVMLVNSYVKRGRDMAVEFLRDVAAKRHYDLVLIVTRYDIDSADLADWERHGIEYSTLYYVILKPRGTGNVQRQDISHFERARNFARIRAVWAMRRSRIFPSVFFAS